MSVKTVETRLSDNIPHYDVGVSCAGNQPQASPVEGQAGDGRLMAGEGDLTVTAACVEQLDAAVVVAHGEQAVVCIS